MLLPDPISARPSFVDHGRHFGFKARPFCCTPQSKAFVLRSFRSGWKDLPREPIALFNRQDSPIARGKGAIG